MNGTIARPTFYEGEILPAADLTAAVDYARDQMARHARQAHSWGIVIGLELSSSSAATAGGQNYAVITINAGVAVDGTGREIIVPSNVQLDPTDFMSQVNPQADPSILYPVFLTGLDQPAAASSSLTGACDSSQSTRMQENYNISYGPPGGELSIADQTAAAVTDAPDDGKTAVWNILLGFVTWSIAASNFTGTADFNPASGIGRRYIGINAAEVVSQSGSLLLATHPAGFSGPNPVLAIQIQEAEGQLAFGTLNPDGSIVNTVTLDTQGNITTKGQFRGALATGQGQARLESGLASHGMTLPLPSGITEDEVSLGNAVVQTFVALHLDGTENPNPVTSPNWGAFPLECYVDDQRRVHCRVRWLELPPAPGAQIVDQPAVCEYLVIAVAKN
jgi:hypothetical protein